MVLKVQNISAASVRRRGKCTFLGTKRSPSESETRGCTRICMLMSLPGDARGHSSLSATDVNRHKSFVGNKNLKSSYELESFHLGISVTYDPLVI